MSTTPAYVRSATKGKSLPQSFANRSQKQRAEFLQLRSGEVGSTEANSKININCAGLCPADGSETRPYTSGSVLIWNFRVRRVSFFASGDGESSI